MVLAQVAAESRVESVLGAYVRGQLPGQPYTRDSVSIGGKPISALDPDPNDFEIFRAELAVLSKRQRNPMVADIIARNAPRLWDAVRMVNSNTKLGFGGASARGGRLLFNPLEPRDLGRAGGFPGTAPPDSWLQVPATVGAARLWPPTSGTIDMTISSLPVLSHVYFGFVNPVANPKVNNIQLVLDADPWPEEILDWDWREGYGDNETPVYELKNPWVIRPGASYRISVRNYITGEDRLTPIGFSVKRALDIIASLAT
jgi:hypothetical protein